MSSQIRRPVSPLRAGLSAFVAMFSGSSRYESLFSLSDDQLAVRGYSRDGLTRSLVAGHAYL